MQKYFGKGEFWLGFATTRKNRKGQSVVRLVWGRVLAFLTACAVAAWVGLTLAGFFFVRHQMDFKGGNYVNVVFPWRWDIYRESLGDAHVEKAFQALEDQEWRNFQLYLRRGLAHSPGNLEGRRLLAELEMSRNAISEAAGILKRGMDFPDAYGDPNYLRFALPVFLRAGEEEALFNILEESTGKDLQPELLQQIALSASRAAWQMGDTGKARQILLDHNLQETAEGLVFSLRLNWEEGRKEEVLSQLQEWLSESPRNENLLQLKINFLVEKEDWEQARQWAILYSLRHPTSTQPSLHLMEIDMRRENWDRLEREFKTVLQSNPPAQVIRSLAAIVRGSGQIPLGEILLDHVNPEEADSLIVILASLETALANQDSNFSEIWLDLAQSHPHLHRQPASLAYLQGLSVVWHQWQGNDADANNSLNALLSAVRSHPEPAVRTARLLISQGHFSIASRILREGQRRHPLHQEFVSEMIRLHIAEGDYESLLPAINQFTQMRRPNRETLRRAQEFLSSDRFMFRPDRIQVLDLLADKT